MKDRPEISGTNYEINKRNGNFKLTLKNVIDKHSGIQEYRFEIYDIRIQMTEPIKIIETKNPEIELPIDETILRNVAYIYKVVAVFDDNEKICEYESEYSDPMKMDGAQFPTVSFEKEKITFERIEGAIVIEDKDNTIDLDTHKKLTVTYTDSVGKVGTLTSQGSLRIPISINNLRANETYKFAVYGTVDLKDGNDPIDECYIGGAIVKTTEPENMIASFISKNNDINNTFNLGFQLRTENEEGEDLEAKTLTGMVFSIYAGQTPVGEKPQGALQKTIKVVDKNVEPYESELKEEYYDKSISITPEFFGAKNEDFKEKYYTILVSDAYDYTDYQNDLPIVNSMFVIKTNGYIPEKPSDTDNALEITIIRNYDKDNPDDNLLAETTVGYKVMAQYDNSGKYAKKIIYRAYEVVKNAEIEKIELDIGEDGVIPSAIFDVKTGTPQGIQDTDELRRGNEYYFTYEVELDLNGDGIAETTYPQPEGETQVILKSKIVSPEKEEPQIIMYPSVSTEKTRTYTYKIKDIDSALVNNKMVATIKNRTVDTKTIEANNEYNAVILENLSKGDLAISVKQARMKNYEEKERILIKEYFEQTKNISNIMYAVSLDSNRIVINLQDAGGNRFNIPNLNSIAAFQVVLKAVDGSTTIVTPLKKASSSNVISVNFNDIGELLKKQIEITVLAYYDSGLVGYDMDSEYVVYQKAYVEAEEKYYYILNDEGNLVENESSMGNLYYRSTGKPNSLKIKNALKPTIENTITLGYTEAGMDYQYGKVLPKQINKTEMSCVGSNIIKFDLIIPGISLRDEKGNLNITTELNKVTMKAKIIPDESTEIKNGIIYIDLYQTDENGNNTVFLRTIEKNVSELKNAMVLDNLSPKTHYGIKMRTIVKVENSETGTSQYEERYLYDVDEEILGKMYYFSTLTDVGIKNIKANYQAESYQDKKINITYELTRITGYDVIKYRLTKKNEETGNFEDIAVNIEDSRAFDNSMTKNIEVQPGSNINFGETYKIEIIPIAYIEDVLGNQIELELGKKEQEFYLEELEEPVIAIKGKRLEDSVEFRVTAYDVDRIIVGDCYTVTILDSKQNDITPDEYKEKKYNIDTINKKFTVTNIDSTQKYTIKVITEVDYENTGTNYKNIIKEYSILPVNKYGISIGNITAITNEENRENIDLLFTGSYKLNEIDSIRYSIYNTSGYTSTNTIEFIPKEFIVEDELYYKFTIEESIMNSGSYYIEIQFLKEDSEQGEIIVETATIDYVLVN